MNPVSSMSNAAGDPDTIRRLDHTQFDLRLTHPWRIARTLGTAPAADHQRFRSVFVRVETVGGVVGFGEAAPSRRYGETVESVAAFLARVDPARLSITNPAEVTRTYLGPLSTGDNAAKTALDLALWDAHGNSRGRSLRQLFGTRFEEGRHRTSFSIGIDAPEVIKEKVLAAAAYPILKLKVGSPEDEANLRALREVAPAKTVRIDANEAWKTGEEAVRQLEKLLKFGPFEFVEQPLPANAPLTELEWLKARSPIPLFADEDYPTAEALDRCVAGFHGVNVKLAKTGGLTAAHGALAAARAAGLKTMIGCMIESSLLISAAAAFSELADYLDLDGNLLISNDPFRGVQSQEGTLSMAGMPAEHGAQATLLPTSDLASWVSAIQ